MSDNVLRDATLDELQGRPWSDVAPLLAPPASAGASAACPGASQGQMALVPYGDGTWDVHAGYPGPWLPQYTARAVPVDGLPQAIAEVAARCAAREKGEGGEGAPAGRHRTRLEA